MQGTATQTGNERTSQTHRWKIPRTHTWTGVFGQVSPDNTLKGDPSNPKHQCTHTHTHRACFSHSQFQEVYVRVQCTGIDLTIANDSPKHCRRSQFDFTTHKSVFKKSTVSHLYLIHPSSKRCDLSTSEILNCHTYVWENVKIHTVFYLCVTETKIEKKSFLFVVSNLALCYIKK